METKTNAEWVKSFEKYLKRRFPGRSTAKHYVSDLNCFLRHIQKSLLSVTRKDIDQYVDAERGQGRAINTVNRRVMSLKSFYEFVKEELNEANRENPVVVKRHTARRPKPLPKDLRDEEVERFLSVIVNERDRAMVLLMLYGGLRVEEVTNLSWDKFDNSANEGQTVKVRLLGKGRKERVVYIPQEVYQTVERYGAASPPVGPGQPLFRNHRKRPITIAGVQYVVSIYADKSGVPATCHQLRHTCARWLAEGDMPLLSLARFLGHAHLETTQRYIDGAAPKVGRHYTAAMSSESAIASAPNPPVQLHPTPTQGQVTVVRPQPQQFQLPAWWAQMPAWWQQDVLAWVGHCWPQWKASRRQKNASTKVGNIKRFWLWQLQQRPFSAWPDLTSHDVQAFVDAQLARDLAPKTVVTTLDDVYRLLRWLQRNEQLAALPTRPLLALPDSLPKHLAPDQLLAIETFAQQQQKGDNPDWLTLALYYVLAHGGLRISEILDLQWRDVNLNARRIFVHQGKERRDRIAYLTQTAVDVLALFMQTVPHAYGDLVFCFRQEPLSYNKALSLLRIFGQEAGIAHLYPLSLRHTYATTLLNNGITLNSLRLLMGHEHLSTTLIYARLADATVENQYLAAMQGVTNLE